MAQTVKSLPAMQETRVGKIPLGEAKGYTLQYSGLENSMGCTVHGVANSQTRRSDVYFTPLPGPSTLQRSLSVGFPLLSPLLISLPIPASPGRCGELGSFSAVTGPETRRGGARERHGAVRSLLMVLAPPLTSCVASSKLLNSEPRLPYLSSGNK